jgi:hypothetical protein
MIRILAALVIATSTAPAPDPGVDIATLKSDAARAQRNYAEKVAREARELRRQRAYEREQARLVAAEEARDLSAPEPPTTAGGIWQRLADCESGDIDVYGSANWAENAGTIYDGGLQFHPSTWTAYDYDGFAPEAWMATPGEQIVVGQRVQAAQGWDAWPSCAAQLGLI